MSLRSIAALLLFATVLFSCFLVVYGAPQAERERTSLRGRVTDGQRRPVEGATVVLKGRENDAAPRRLLTLSANDGYYSFAHLDPGIDYELSATHSGLASRTRPLRTSSGDESVTIDLVLAPPIQFEEIAAKAGVNFTLHNGASGRFFQPEIMTGGVATFDYNNDGCIDIFFANGAELPQLTKTSPAFYNRLYRNNCDSTFTDVTEKANLAGQGYSMGAAAGDYDNDGSVDLYVTGVRGGTLYRNRGDGTFEDVTARAGLQTAAGGSARPWSVAAGWFDYDNDGWLDLFVSNYVVWDPAMEVNCPIQNEPFYCHPRVYRGLPDQLFHNNRDGTFTDVSVPSGIARHIGKGMGVAFGDFNGDGLADIFVANDSVPNFLFQNLGKGTFKEVALEAGVAYLSSGRAVAGMGADFRDFDDDGREDIAMDAMYFDTFPLFRNVGKPNFFVDDTVSSGVADATHTLTGWGMGLYDFDNDGHKDLFFATSHFPGSEPYARSPAPTSNRVLRNLGNSLFGDVSAFAGAAFQIADLYHGAAFADFDNDGRLDIIVTALNGPARLFRNVSPPVHWLALRLIGTRSNRDGLGASVQLTLPNGRIEFNHANTSVGYASSSEPLVRFGLGPYDRASRIEVHWPSGRVQLLAGVIGDRVVTVTE